MDDRFLGLGIALLIAIGSVMTSVVFAAPPTLVGIADSSETIEYQIVRRLIDAELFDTAVSRCKRLVDGATPQSLQQAKRFGWLLEAIVERDAVSAPNIAAALKQAEMSLADYRRDESPSLNGLWLEFQLEQLRFHIARRSVANFLAVPTSTFPREDAIKAIRKILDRANELLHGSGELTVAGRDLASKRTATDTAGLRNRIHLLKIDGLLLRSQCYPHSSDDAVASSAEAMEIIQQLRGQVESDWPGRKLLELARFRSLVASNLGENAVSEIETWLKTEMDASVTEQAIATAVEAQLNLGNIDAASAWLHRSTNPNRPPEIALAALKTQIARWKTLSQNSASLRSQDENATKAQLNAILETKNQIAQAFGPYWGRRAEAAVTTVGQATSTKSTTLSDSSLELLKLDIRQRIAANDWNDAIERLDQAESIASQAGELSQAFAFAKTAIGLLQRQSQADQTSIDSSRGWIERALDRSTRFANQPSADLLHLASVEASLSIDPDRYSDRLLEHLRLWPESPTSEDARRRWTEFMFLSGNVSEHLDRFLQSTDSMTADELLYGFAVMELQTNFAPNQKSNESRIRLWKKLLSLSLDGDPDLKEAREATIFLASDFDHWLVDGGIDSIRHQSLTRSKSLEVNTEIASTQLASAILRVLQSSLEPTQPTKPSDLDDATTAILSSSKGNSLASIGLLLQLDLALSNILRVRSDGSAKDASKQDWLDRCLRIHDVAAKNLPTHRSQISPELYEVLEQALLVSKCRLSAVNGGWQVSASELENRKTSSPRSSVWGLELARLLELQDETGLKRGLGIYRQLANGSPIGSNVWFEARFGAIRCLRRLGQTSEADQLVATILALVPDAPERWHRRLASMAKKL